MFFDVLDARSMVHDLPGARPLEKVSGRVDFSNIVFSYESGKKALDGVSFTAEPGQVVALVGETGAGKSTAMGLLLRQYDPQQGQVLIDGIDVRQVTLDSLRANIGVVFQESLLFFRTIEENLKVGRPDATDEEMVRAARQAQAHDFILQQPQGYQTLVGERGSKLSGGERQRLAIARVLLKNPPILILDEATSALDSATESQGAEGLPGADAGADHPDHRPPPGDHPQCRSHPGVSTGPNYRARHLRRTCQGRRHSLPSWSQPNRAHCSRNSKNIPENRSGDSRD